VLLVVGDGTALELGQELQDPRPALGRVIELDVQLRDPLQVEPPTELVPDERHGPSERGDRRVALGGLADDADPDLGVPKIRGRLDLGDRGEPHPRIGDLARHDLADLLPKQLVHALRPLAHLRDTAARYELAQAETARDTVCVVKHSMTSPSSRSWKPARPMPHS